MIATVVFLAATTMMMSTTTVMAQEPSVPATEEKGFFDDFFGSGDSSVLDGLLMKVKGLFDDGSVDATGKLSLDLNKVFSSPSDTPFSLADIESALAGLNLTALNFQLDDVLSTDDILAKFRGLTADAGHVLRALGNATIEAGESLVTANPFEVGGKLDLKAKSVVQTLNKLFLKDSSSLALDANSFLSAALLQLKNSTNIDVAQSAILKFGTAIVEGLVDIKGSFEALGKRLVQVAPNANLSLGAAPQMVNGVMTRNAGAPAVVKADINLARGAGLNFDGITSLLGSLTNGASILGDGLVAVKSVLNLGTSGIGGVAPAIAAAKTVFDKAATLNLVQSNSSVGTLLNFAKGAVDFAGTVNVTSPTDLLGSVLKIATPDGGLGQLFTKFFVNGNAAVDTTAMAMMTSSGSTDTDAMMMSMMDGDGDEDKKRHLRATIKRHIEAAESGEPVWTVSYTNKETRLEKKVIDKSSSPAAAAQAVAAAAGVVAAASCML